MGWKPRSAPADRQAAGRLAEALAARYLQRAGLRVIERNFRCPMGEIDLIALDGAELVFVEVRHRRAEGYGSAAESVTAPKQRRLQATAALYLQCRPELAEHGCRFDVLALSGALSRPRLEWIKDAFQA